MQNVLDRRDVRKASDERAVSRTTVDFLVAASRVSLSLSLVATVLFLLIHVAFAETIDVTVRRAPYTVGSASTKSEIARCPCKYCGSKTSYNRTYRWDYDRHVWNETTKSENVPNVCRKCRQKEKDQEKLERKERKLDAAIEYQRTRLRIKDKKQELESLRKEAR